MFQKVFFISVNFEQRLVELGRGVIIAICALPNAVAFLLNRSSRRGREVRCEAAKSSRTRLLPVLPSSLTALKRAGDAIKEVGTSFAICAEWRRSSSSLVHLLLMYRRL
jgi:hypothetical protein